MTVPGQAGARDLQPTDLDDLAWSGGDSHLDAIRAALEDSWQGGVDVVVLELPNGRLVALGAVDFRPHADGGTLWMLSVHETLQSLGLGTLLIEALEERIVQRGREMARLTVELDNPRARALYERLGYRVDGQSVVEYWPSGPGQTYVTTCLPMSRRLGSPTPLRPRPTPPTPPPPPELK